MTRLSANDVSVKVSLARPAAADVWGRVLRRNIKQ